ncbi:MAG: hypothetical protein ACRCT1_08540 [Microcoleaceae cyanobacterium]|jgi:hypothetical protein
MSLNYRRRKEEGRRKKEEGRKSRVSAIKKGCCRDTAVPCPYAYPIAIYFYGETGFLF